MIGGTDIVIPISNDPALLGICARIVQLYWPNACLEDALSGNKYSSYSQLPIGQLRELLIYPDAGAEAAWDAEDASAAPNSLLYLILSNSSLTVVVDEPDTPEMQALLAAIRHALHDARNGAAAPARLECTEAAKDLA